jgi:hypothetical protein
MLLLGSRLKLSDELDAERVTADVTFGVLEGMGGGHEQGRDG